MRLIKGLMYAKTKTKDWTKPRERRTVPVSFQTVPMSFRMVPMSFRMVPMSFQISPLIRRIPPTSFRMEWRLICHTIKRGLPLPNAYWE